MTVSPVHDVTVCSLYESEREKERERERESARDRERRESGWL